MPNEIKIALIGISGYGELYAKALFKSAEQNGVRFVAGIDPYAQRSPVLNDLLLQKIPVYDDLDQFYAQDDADLVIVSAPIQLHAKFTCNALKHGSNVLCEKPLSGTIQEGLSMLRMARESRKFVAIGYQWSFSKAIHALRDDVQKGVLGQPLQLKTKALWPRSDKY